MTVFIDKDHKCHAEAAEGRQAVDADFFNNKCPEFIEGYMLVPGKATFPWKDSRELQAAQAAADKAQLEHEISDMKAALEKMGVAING